MKVSSSVNHETTAMTFSTLASVVGRWGPALRPVPPHRLSIVLRNAPAVRVHVPEEGLRVGVPLLCGAPIPYRRLSVVPYHRVAPVHNDAQVDSRRQKGWVSRISQASPSWARRSLESAVHLSVAACGSARGTTATVTPIWRSAAVARISGTEHANSWKWSRAKGQPGPALVQGLHVRTRTRRFPRTTRPGCRSGSWAG